MFFNLDYTILLRNSSFSTEISTQTPHLKKNNHLRSQKLKDFYFLYNPNFKGTSLLCLELMGTGKGLNIRLGDLAAGLLGKV